MKNLFRMLLSLLAVAGTCFAVSPQPNIIFILCDDMGYGDLGVTGHPYVRSPHIDKLAAEGIRFENGYMSGAWCSPSRSALMSGLYPSRYFNLNREMDPDRVTVYRVLKSAGYTTAHFGKWHMSGKKPDDPTPDMYGVDEDFIANGNREGWTKEERRKPHWREHTTERYVDLTIDFITRHKDSGKPFYVNLWVYPTHSYIDPTPEMLEIYKDLPVDIDDFENPLQREFLEWISQQGDVQDAMRAYCSDVTALDNHIGRLMTALKELDLDDNTMVIFSSDNGPGPVGGIKKGLDKRIKDRPTLINCVGSSGPFRDRKTSLHDGGTHVPLFVRWPGKVPAGMVNSETNFTGVDLLPTLAALAGVTIPEGLDGENLLSALTGEPVERSQPHFWNDRPGWTAMRDGKWKAHLQKDRLRLYDLTSDPSESVDLAKKYPEIADGYRRKMKAFEVSIPRKKK